MPHFKLYRAIKIQSVRLATPVQVSMTCCTHTGNLFTKRSTLTCPLISPVYGRARKASKHHYHANQHEYADKIKHPRGRPDGVIQGISPFC